MSPSEARAEFSQVLDALRLTRARKVSESAQIEGEYKQTLEAAMPKRGRGRLRTAPEALGAERVQEIARPFRKRLDDLLDACQQDERRGQDRLRELAAIAEVRSGPERVVLHVSSHAYASTNDGEGYARGLTEIHVAELALRGVEAVSVRVEYGYEIRAHLAEEIDVEICRHAPGFSVREILKACWSRGLNPRVFMPFLGHDAESRYGIDYHGRDVHPDTL